VVERTAEGVLATDASSSPEVTAAWERRRLRSAPSRIVMLSL
jgi:hypothetical protein